MPTVEEIKQIQNDWINNHVPLLYKQMMQRALNDELSPRQTIKAKCLECVGFNDKVNAIGGCTSYRCGLWTKRPFKNQFLARGTAEGSDVEEYNDELDDYSEDSQDASVEALK